MAERLTEWSRVIETLHGDGQQPAIIVESWRRSEAAGVPRDAVAPSRVSEQELEARRQQSARWLHIAQPHVEWLSRAFKHVAHVACVTDRDGIVLSSAGDEVLMDKLVSLPGSNWSEAALGTNGAGTALASGLPVAVVGEQHYVATFADCTCTAAPIYGADASVIGALNISSAARDATPERLFVVAHAAYAISRVVALQESEARRSSAEERLLAALSASDAGTFRWDPRTDRFMDFDDSLKRLFGFSPEDRVEHTADVIRRLHPDDREPLAAAMDRCRRGADFEMELRAVLPDGSIRWLFDRAKMTRDAHGNLGHLVGACIDITRHKEIEAKLAAFNRQLAESESRLSTAVRVADLGVWEYDTATQRAQGDARWADLLGVVPGQTLSVEDFHGMLDPEERRQFEHLRDAAGAGVASGFFASEHRVVRPDGTRRWLAVRGRRIEGKAGSGRRRWLGTVMDVTQQREAEARLVSALEREQRATALLDAILDAAPIGIGFWDRELRFQRVNPLLAEINGLPEEAHLGRRPDELLPNIDGLDDILRQWRRVMETGQPLLNVEVRGQTPGYTDRERIWSEDFFPVRIDDEVIGMGAVIEEVTERRQAEDALRASERRYRTLFNSMDQGFCVIERLHGEPADYRYVEVNPAVARQSGVGDVMGKTIREMSRDQDEADEWIRIYDQILESGEGQRFERALSCQDRTLEVYAYRLEDHSERRLGVLFADVTSRRKAEEDLRDADRAKDEFLAVLGHELRNPLAPLRTGLELLDEEPALIQRIRPMMERQLTHLARLVDDLLDISRISRGRIELQRAPLDVNAPIEAAVEQTRSAMAKRRHDFQVDLSKAALVVSGDFERLTQVFANLLSNAARYTQPGGRVRISSEQDNGHVVVRVSDTGYGIPPERFKKLFKLFSQIPEHHARTGGGGLGIGLALAQQLVEMHGGSIRAHSEGMERGSEFVVRLPATDAAPRADEVHGSGRGGARAHRVLVVDDNVDAAEGMRMLLERKGQVARAVHDGAVALGQVEEFGPEVVLLDLGMPGMDGLEVARRIRASHARSITLVAVTGWGQDEDRHRTRAAGFDAHLTKPIQWAQIAPILADAPH